jgi:hypothetical protein
MYPNKSRDLFRLPRQIAVIIAAAASMLLSCTLAQKVLTSSTAMESDSTGEPGFETTTQATGIFSSTTAPNVMGIALNPNGDSVALATFGSLGLSDMNGVVAANIPAGTGGWTMAQAQGYAPGFADLGQGRTEPFFFEVRLTPWSDFSELEAAETAELVTQIGEELSLAALVDGSSFVSQPVLVSLTWIDRLDVGPAFVPLSSGQTADLQWAFSLQATDKMGETADLADGKSVVVRIQGTAAQIAQPTLALFDPETGTWTVQPDVCADGIEGGIECTLTSLPTLAGVFSPRVTAVVPTKAERVALAQPVALLPQPGRDIQDEAMKAAYARLQSWQQQKDAGEPVSDDELQSILDDLAKAAEEFAKGHHNETGKFHLMFAAQYVALSAGDPALDDRLKAEAAELADEIARELLEKGDCGRVREMLRAIEQLNLLGGDPSLEAALYEKIQKLLSTCDLWTGKIEFYFNVEGNHPGDLEGYSKTAGADLWTEEHEVRMATDASTMVLTGEDHVRLSFPMITYTDSEECPSQFFYYGDPPELSVNLNFNGKYDGKVFSIGDLTPADAAKAINISQRWLLKDHEGSKGCVVKTDTPFSFPSYQSVLMHGLFDAIPITLQEMLDGPSYGGTGFAPESILGNEAILNAMPEAGIFPFKDGLVFWSFTHVQKLLPLE